MNLSPNNKITLIFFLLPVILFGFIYEHSEILIASLYSNGGTANSVEVNIYILEADSSVAAQKM